MAYARLRVVPNPAGFEFRDWAEVVVGYNAGLHNQLSPDLDWREFGEQMSLAYPATPRPESFSTWQEWADTLRTTLQL